jgi:hypothetical protein
VEIILEWSMEDEKEWDPNGVDEHPDRDLGNVQS